jgi:hypothetical protein
MILYEYLMANKHLIRDLMKLNVIPVSVVFHMEVYEQYRFEFETEKAKMVSVQAVAEKNRINTRTVERIVSKMEKPVYGKSLS